MHTIICTSSAHKSNQKNLEFQIFEEINELLILTTTEKSPLFQKHVLTNSNFLVSFLGIFLHIGTFIFNQSSFQLWIGLQFGRIKVYINFPVKRFNSPPNFSKAPSTKLGTKWFLELWREGIWKFCYKFHFSLRKSAPCFGKTSRHGHLLSLRWKYLLSWCLLPQITINGFVRGGKAGRET